MEGFHAHSGWYFRRESDGSVTAYVDDSGGEPRQVTFDDGTWASIVAAVSATGDNGQTHRAALALHGGTVMD